MLRIPILVGGLLLFQVLASPVASAQTQPQNLEIAAGVQYGIQDLERPVTPGWTVSSNFDLGGQTFVVEGGWHRGSYVRESITGVTVWADPGGDFEIREDVLRSTSQSRWWMVMGGVRGGGGEGRVVPFYQVLAGGFSARFRTDYDWPASIDVETENATCGDYLDGVLIWPCDYVPYPAFDEERSAGFLMQPGMGIDVNVWRRFTFRVAADLPIFASPDYVVLRPRLSARVVVGLGR